MASSSSIMLISDIQSLFQWLYDHGLTVKASFTFFMLACFCRWLVALHPYSGAGQAPMYGDYEAQRHWMEITIHLPIHEWYWNTTNNDLMYWGLDYPPLTAYVSYLYGLIAHSFLPAMVALGSSKGYETLPSKTFMRLSVLISDALIYIPSILLFAQWWFNSTNKKRWSLRQEFFLLVSLQPALLLIDHGHFQYNGICLGLTTFGIGFIMKEFYVLGSFCYCLALNFKQMTLYYAPVFGCFLLSKCFYASNGLKGWILFFKLGLTVLGTFILIWLPFWLYPSKDHTSMENILQVIHRIFPVARGLFEDKVANAWCLIDWIFKIRNWIKQEDLLILCLVCTILGFLPSCIDLFRRSPSNYRFLIALVNCSLSFFLFSYQVHEKTILIPLLPITLLAGEITLISGWMCVIATFSMYHLLWKDGLIIPYCVFMYAYICVGIIPYFRSSSLSQQVPLYSSIPPGYTSDRKPCNALKWLIKFSLFGMILLQCFEWFIALPTKYPHLWMYLFAVYSCGHYIWMLLYCTYWQWTLRDDQSYQRKMKTN